MPESACTALVERWGERGRGRGRRRESERCGEGGGGEGGQVRGGEWRGGGMQPTEGRGGAEKLGDSRRERRIGAVLGEG